MRFKIKRIGSFGDSKTDFIVRLCKSDRDHLGIQDRALVKVKKGNKKVIALVKQQFMDLASYPEACSVNQLLTSRLTLSVNDNINIPEVYSLNNIRDAIASSINIINTI